MQQVSRDAREAPGRRGGGSGRGREMGGGEMEGGRRPPPRPRGLPHVALVSGLLRVPAGTKEELRRSGACPLPTAPLPPQPRQGWRGAPRYEAGGGVGRSPRAHRPGQVGLLHPQLSLPRPPQGPYGPGRRRGPCVADWMSEAQTKGPPRSHRGGGEATSERHDPVFCRREARPGPPLYLPRPHPHPQCEDGDCAPGPLSGI